MPVSGDVDARDAARRAARSRATLVARRCIASPSRRWPCRARTSSSSRGSSSCVVATITLPHAIVRDAVRRRRSSTSSSRAFDAELRLERAGLVVDAGVDDAAVVAGLVGGELGLLLADDERTATGALQQRPRGRQADDAAADDRDVVCHRTRIIVAREGTSMARSTCPMCTQPLAAGPGGTRWCFACSPRGRRLDRPRGGRARVAAAASTPGAPGVVDGRGARASPRRRDRAGLSRAARPPPSPGGRSSRGTRTSGRRVFAIAAPIPGGPRRGSTALRADTVAVLCPPAHPRPAPRRPAVTPSTGGSGRSDSRTTGRSTT